MTIDRETHAMLEEIQDLCGRKIPLSEFVKMMAKEQLSRLRKEMGVDHAREHDRPRAGRKQSTKARNTKYQADANTHDRRTQTKTDDGAKIATGSVHTHSWAVKPDSDSDEKDQLVWDFDLGAARSFDRTRDANEKVRRRGNLDVGRTTSGSPADSTNDIYSRADTRSPTDPKLRCEPTCGADLNFISNPEAVSQQAPPLTRMTEAKAEPRKRKYISVHLERECFARAEGQCEFIDPLTGKRCAETRYLQMEHRIPVALGGTDDLENIQILCATHNRLRAVEAFGRETMANYVPSLR